MFLFNIFCFQLNKIVIFSKIKFSKQTDEKHLDEQKQDQKQNNKISNYPTNLIIKEEKKDLD